MRYESIGRHTRATVTVSGPSLLCIEKLLDASRCRVDSRLVTIEKSGTCGNVHLDWLLVQMLNGLTIDTVKKTK